MNPAGYSEERMICLFSLISLLMIPVICSQRWEVQYSIMKTCTLKGSAINLSGSFKHPNNLTVTETFWTCGIELKVTDLRVEIPEEVVEGESPVLFCKTTCNLSDKTNFTWYKNGKRLSESIGLNQLLLRSVSSEDTGKYSCAVRDQKHLSSPALTLSVRYPPKNFSVSISPKSSSFLIRVTVGITAAVVLTSVILLVFIGLLIRRKRATPSEEQQHGGSGHNKTLESPEDAYMSLEPKSRCSEYDTLDNMKRSCENTDHPEAQDPTYYNIDK